MCVLFRVHWENRGPFLHCHFNPKNWEIIAKFLILALAKRGDKIWKGWKITVIEKYDINMGVKLKVYTGDYKTIYILTF